MNKKPPIRRSRTLVRSLPKLGLYSRSQSYELIRMGKVKINGSTVTDPNKTVAPTDRIQVDNKEMVKRKPRYILLNKPAGYVTTRKDEKSRPTVYDILGDAGGWVFPVGRLDKDTEGLLVFTNDTALGDLLTNPANKIARTYIVTAEGIVSEKDVKKALGGIDIGRGEKSRPTIFRIIAKGPSTTVVEVVITEGKNREIRRLFNALGKPVKRLIRTRFGPYDLGDLAAGKWCEVRKSENGDTHFRAMVTCKK